MSRVRVWGGSKDGLWWRGRYLRPRRSPARRAEAAMNKALEARGFVLEACEKGYQGVWTHPRSGCRVVVTRITQQGVAEAEVYDRRFRPDVRITYNLAVLGRLLDRPKGTR